MSQDIFIGVDGGATQSRVRVEDSSGKLLGQAVGGPANIRLSVDGAWKSINQAVVKALEPQRISLDDKNYRFHAGMGLAGCEVEAAYRAYLEKPHPFATILLTSDARTACVGAHSAKDGAIIIVGTGVVGYQIQNNHGMKVGGWGFPYGDEGGGAWLGMEAVRLTFQWLDRRIDKTPLLQDVFSFFHDDMTQLVDWVNRATAHEFAQLAPLVVNRSQQQDSLALQLMQQAAEEINRIGATLEKNHLKNSTDENSLPCCLFGGIAPFIEPWLSDALRARLVPSKGDANTGAILMIKQLMEKTMTRIVLTGATIYTEQAILPKATLVIADQQIQAIQENFSAAYYPDAEIFQLPSAYHVVPGFIDLHVHGANGADVMDASHDSLQIISEALAREGITGFLATTMTAEKNHIDQVLKVTREFVATKGADLLGIHLEGPFLSPAKMGAQRGDKMLLPDTQLMQHWQTVSNHFIKLVTLAPEQPHSLELIRYLKQQEIIASMGHSNANYDEAVAAIAAGCSHATHLFNAMSGIHHRQPGMVTAALLADSVLVELIADGVHLHPAMLELVLKIKSKDQILLVTDAMRAKCLADGCYELGGQAVMVHHGQAKLADGTLAGSVLTMPVAIKNMLQLTHCTLMDAITMAAVNPAKALNLFHRKGSLLPQKDADVVVLDETLQVVMTFCQGRPVFQRECDNYFA